MEGRAKAGPTLLRRQPKTPKLGSAARLPHFCAAWLKVTTNNFILRIVREGYKLQFHSPPVMPPYSPRSMSDASTTVTATKIQELLREGALKVVDPSPDQFLSHIFPVPKRTPGEFRIIFDLSILNLFIRKITFRMDNFSTLISLICPGDFLVSIDLADAYHAIAVHPLYHRFLTFVFMGVFYQYVCLPQGLTSSPRIFTKVVRAVLTYLRSFAVRIAAWLDDFLISAGSADLASSQASLTVKTFEELGFIPNLAKSHLVPVQHLQHVGLVWDTVAFTVSIPEDKILGVREKCRNALSSRVSIRFLSSILGSLEFFRWGCPIAALHLRGLQRFVGLLLSKGLDYDVFVTPSEEARTDLDWWASCGPSLPPRSLSPFLADITLFSDASDLGWGAWTSSHEVWGKWSPEELDKHINYRELLSVFLSFQTFFRSTYSCSILIRSDSQTVVSHVNKQGGTAARDLCNLALSLWEFCVARDITISATHIAGVENDRADWLSRLDFLDHDYFLSSSVFLSISEALSFSLSVDLFASRLNFKISNFVSWHSDPLSSLVDAFSFKWGDNIYLFPPLPLLSKVFDKFIADNVIHGLIICPYWPSQPWFSGLLELLIDSPFLISDSCIVDPSRLLPKHCHFLGWPIGTVRAQRQAFRAKLPAAPSGVSQRIPWLGTKGAGVSSAVGVLDGKLVMVRSV